MLLRFEIKALQMPNLGQILHLLSPPPAKLGEGWVRKKVSHWLSVLEVLYFRYDASFRNQSASQAGEVENRGNLPLNPRFPVIFRGKICEMSIKRNFSSPTKDPTFDVLLLGGPLRGLRQCRSNG